MIAIALGYDQPGVAARIAYHGVGEFVELEDLTAQTFTRLIQKVLSVPSYRVKAQYLQKVIAETRGPDQGAEIVESVLDA